MTITDPTAIAFANEEIRQAADLMAQLYNRAQAIRARWTALGGAALIPNDAAEVIEDGADLDGRPVINGADANNIINRLIELTDDYDATSAAKLNTILAVVVNPIR